MISFSKKFIVEDTDTAKEVGSGDLEVLATPVMIAMIENTAKDYLQKELAVEETSVGTFVEVSHVKPTKVGAQIIVKVSVDSQEKTKINFSFKVYEKEEMIAYGKHQRTVVLTEMFLKRLSK